MKSLTLSLLSYYAICRYNTYLRERDAMWKDLTEYQDDQSITDMLCDWIMQCSFNG